MKHTKFWISVMILALSFVALMASKIDSGAWVTVAIAVTGIYGAANVGATFAHRSPGASES